VKAQPAWTDRLLMAQMQATRHASRVGGIALAAAETMSSVTTAAAVGLSLLLGGWGGFQGTDHVVSPDEDLQAILNAAQPGQTIWLEAGATYVGHFKLPSWSGTDERPIVLRSAGPDVVTPGERMTPGRASRLAKLRSPDTAPVISTSPGTRFWRVELVELLANGGGGNEIVALGSSSSDQRSASSVPGDLVLDRLYIHGDEGVSPRRAVLLNSVRTTISNCYISGIKTVGVDSQAIVGWNGPGEYLIENNYLEAAGENVMFGGADPAIQGLTPTGIVVRGNIFSKPLAWKESGAKWQIKNLLELKNARRVTIERNLFERNWAQAQSGYSILFTVRNQDGGCPWCQVEDVRFERNVVRDVAAGISILGVDDAHPSRQTTGIVIRNNLFDGVDSRRWGGDGYLLQLVARPRRVVVDHNTVIQGESGGIAKIDGVAEEFEFTNNISAHGFYGIIATDHAPGNDTIKATLPGGKVVANVMAGGNPSLYPSGNLFPSMSDFRQQFVDFDARDFRLRPSSMWMRQSTEGGALGADLPQGTRVAIPRE
jgi:hypothetical protein